MVYFLLYMQRFTTKEHFTLTLRLRTLRKFIYLIFLLLTYRVPTCSCSSPQTPNFQIPNTNHALPLFSLILHQDIHLPFSSFLHIPICKEDIYIFLYICHPFCLGLSLYAVLITGDFSSVHPSAYIIQRTRKTS